MQLLSSSVIISEWLAGCCHSSPFAFPFLAEDAILEHARQVNLERAEHMPNFVADEVITFYGDREGSRKWNRIP